MAPLRIFTDRHCLEHASPPGFPEVAARLGGILERLGREPWEVVPGGSREDVDAAVSRVHPGEHLGRLDRAVGRGDALLDSADNPLSPGTARATRAAVGASLAAVDWVMEEAGRRAFAAVRPPGHHAERDRAMGFCYANNVAIAAEHLRARHGVERVAIFDFDVHHGNGTQHLFEDRADVFFASVHQYPFYPGTGSAAEKGRGAGEGATLNVPLPAGCGDAEYRRVLAEKIVPALRRFAPDVLLVSAGFDAWKGDPLGGMRVGADSFEEWGARLSELAEDVCEGRSVAFLEGGYDLTAVPDLVVRYLRGTAGEGAGLTSAARDG